jgi:hypothetical protein
MSFEISVQQLLHIKPEPAPTRKRLESTDICPTCKERPKSIAPTGVPQPYCRPCARLHTKRNRANRKKRREDEIRNANLATVTIK